MKTPIILFAGAGLLLLAGVGATSGVAVPGARLSVDEVRSLARRTLARSVFNADIIPPEMLVRIAWIESNFNPTATRAELHLGDASVGIMQTLIGTAKWLEKDTRWRRNRAVEAVSLFDADTSMFYGAGFLHWLQLGYFAGNASEEMLVRSYNTGQGNWQSSAGAAYWAKYLKAIEEVG